MVAEVIEPGQIEAAISAIYGTIGRKDGDFWMKPEEELTERLVADLSAYSEEQRLVILVDTYEIIGDFDGWVRDSLFSKLGEYATLVIAGRRRLEGRQWQEWAELMRQTELKPLSDAEARTYLMEKRNVENPQVVAAMVDYADGHPLTLAMLADLTDQIEIDDLSRIPERRQVLRSVIDRVTQNVATNMRAALEACAILRVVNQDSLAYLLDAPHVETIFDELQRFEFVKLRDDGIALHDAVRAAMNEEMRWQSPARYRQLNEKAAEYYGKVASANTSDNANQAAREMLYHLICADEAVGINRFNEEVDRYVLYGQMGAAHMLVNDADTYPISDEANIQWVKYARARVASIDGNERLALPMFEQIAESRKADALLKAYALSEVAKIKKRTAWVSRANGIETLLQLVEESNRLLPPDDPHQLVNLLSLAGAVQRVGRMEEAEDTYQKAVILAEQTGQTYLQARVLVEWSDTYGRQGKWRLMFDIQEKAQQLRSLVPSNTRMYADLAYGFGFYRLWTGRYSEPEKRLKQHFPALAALGILEMIGAYRDLGVALALQNKFAEAWTYFSKAYDDSLKAFGEKDLVSVLFHGFSLLHKGDIQQAVVVLEEGRTPGWIPDRFYWLGRVHEQKGDWLTAVDLYDQARSQFGGRMYVLCSAVSGLLRARFRQGQLGDIQGILAEAEQLAQQYEYNDHLASLRLTQGHVAWDGHLDAWGVGFDTALQHYQHALVYALRFNRFLLDEVLSGRPQGTPLQPVIPTCLAHGEEGQRILRALRDWWQTGVINVGIPRLDTISPLPEGTPLLEAERIAREREPGNGAAQTPVLAQLAAAID